MPSFFIVGHVWRILGRGGLSIREQPRKSPSWIGLRVNPKKYQSQSNQSQSIPVKLKQFVGKLPTNCLSVFDHFVKLALKGLNNIKNRELTLLLPYLEFQETADLVIFTEEILSGKLYFLCSVLMSDLNQNIPTVL